MSTDEAVSMIISRSESRTIAFISRLFCKSSALATCDIKEREAAQSEPDNSSRSTKRTILTESNGPYYVRAHTHHNKHISRSRHDVWFWVFFMCAFRTFQNRSNGRGPVSA